jgi:hydrogenase maturation protease
MDFEMSETQANRKIVLGLGNTLNRDEGLGVHALKMLEERLCLPPTPEGSPRGALRETDGGEDLLEFLDGGVLGLNLLPLVEESSHLLVLDAVNARREPGTVIELKRDEIPLYSGIKLSDHQVTFQEVLGLASFRGKLPPHLHLVGLQPADLATGVELSPLITAAMPQVIERAIAILGSWRLIDKEQAS